MSDTPRGLSNEFWTIISVIIALIFGGIPALLFVYRMSIDLDFTKKQQDALQGKYDALSLALQNLKGPKGDKGEAGERGQRGEQGPKGDIGNMPANAIIALASGLCPQGWTNYKKADGRFLLGNSTKEPGFPSEGGSLFDMIDSTKVPRALTEQDDRLPLLQKDSSYRAFTRNGIRTYHFYPPYTTVVFCEKSKS